MDAGTILRLLLQSVEQLIVFIGILMLVVGTPYAFAKGYLWKRMRSRQIELLMGPKGYVDIWFRFLYETLIAVTFSVIGGVVLGVILALLKEILSEKSAIFETIGLIALALFLIGISLWLMPSMFGLAFRQTAPA